MTGLKLVPNVSIGEAEILASLASGRLNSFFSEDMIAFEDQLNTGLASKRILVIGGAGSIGGAVVQELANRNPATLHVVDQCENNLAELVRDLRSRPAGLALADFRTYPLDYGSEPMHMLLNDFPSYDVVFNFSALKHVRSEKDIYSLLQMLDTNVVKQVRFMRWLSEVGFSGRYFCVSTDKAANPVSLMGASKRLMEHVIFSKEVVPNFQAKVTSARFANVAFSDGSLLHGFLNRLRKHQPLAVPQDVRRYFVSLEEAAHICLLAAVLSKPNTIVVPRLNPKKDLVRLDVIAEKVLKHFGFTASIYADEEQSRSAVTKELKLSRYPLLVTPLNTSGEKPYEEFVGIGEQAEDIGFKTLEGVAYLPAKAGTMLSLYDEIESILSGKSRIDKDATVDKISKVIPEFNHIETDKNLDQRM